MNEDALQFLRNRFGDAYLHAVNRGSFEAVGADATFRREYGDLFGRPDTLHLIVGSDSGLLLRWAAARRGRGSRLLFIEPEELVEPLRAHCAEWLEDDAVAITGPAGWRSAAERFHLSDYAAVERIGLVQSIGARDGNLPAYRAIARTVETAVAALNFQMAVQRHGRVFLERQIANLPFNLHPASALRGRFSGVTAVVLGGGPSLDAVLPWVERHRDRLLVIAVSRIARRLLDAGVRPDIVTAIDPHPVGFEVSRDALRLGEDVLLVHSHHVETRLLAQWPGPTRYCGARFPWKEDADRDNLPNRGPTVTNLALSLAGELGCARVVLGGVDLCFSPEGHTHAQGSIEREIGPLLTLGHHQVETNDGRRADTDHAFAQAIDLMAEQVAELQRMGCRVINPAPGAARIPGVEHLPLERLTPEGPAPDTGLLRAPAGDAEEERRRLDEHLRELTRARHLVREVERLCERALEDNRRLFAPEGDFRHKKRMDKIERRLDRRFHSVTPMVKLFGLDDFLRLLRPGGGAWAERELRDWGERYYRIYRDAARRLIECMDTAGRRIRSARRELDADATLDAFADEWIEADIPGRHRRWCRRHPDACEHADAARTRLEEAFAAQLAGRDGEHAASTARRHALGPVRGRLQLAFLDRDAVTLERLADALAHQSGDEARELEWLARGYLAECLDDAEGALTHYGALIDAASRAIETRAASNPRLEDALRQTTRIALDRHDTDTALRTLDALAALSPAYEPQYAHLLRLCGRIRDAVDVYVDYLRKVPEDQAVMLRLGQLFQEAGALDSARWAYDQVLERSPGHRTALQLRASLEGAESPA